MRRRRPGLYNRTIVNFSVPTQKLSRADTIRLGDRVALVAGRDLVEPVAVFCYARHGRRVDWGGRGGGGCRGLGGSGSCRRERGARAIICKRANHAV